MTNITSQIDYDKIRERFESGNGNAYWRGLEDLANSSEFQEKVSKEFPGQEDRWTDPVARRTFLQVMGASLALSGLAGCTGFSKPKEHILPYLKQPEHMVLGKALYFATAAVLNGYGYPVLVESHEGRPTKIEGNPESAASLGAAFAWMQATILDMYDPDRSQTTTYLNEPRDWSEFVTEIQKAVSQLPNGGEGFAILTETITSPALADQINKVLAKYPGAQWVQYDPAGYESVREGARLAFGEYVETVYDFSVADIVLSLDADFMVDGPGALRYARQFTNRRRVTSSDDTMNRYYAIESSPTMSGTLADHRKTFKPSAIEGVARAIAAKLGVEGAGTVSEEVESSRQFIDTLVADLQAANGKALVVAGAYQTPAVHSLVHAINSKLGAVGITVRYTEPVEARPTNQTAELKNLVQAMNEGRVSALAILGGNPVYSAPADLNFKDALKKVKFSVHNSEYQDETSEYCAWHVAAPHYLESWGDVRAFDGTVSIVQPLIAPLFNSHSAFEILTAVEGSGVKSSFEQLQKFWKERWGGEFDKAWRKALHDGFIADSAATPKNVTAKTDAASFPTSEPVQGIEVSILPDPSVFDGRYANNAWLQELPKPFTKLTWDNSVLMSLKTAHKLGVKNEDVVKLTVNGVSVEGPVYITMGHSHDAVTVHLGYGRTRSGRVAMTEDESFFTPRGKRLGIVDFVGTKPRGFNVYSLVKSDTNRVGLAAKIERTGKTYELASTQIHFSLDDNDVRPDRDIPVVGEAFNSFNTEYSELKNRGIIRRGTLEEFKKHEITQKHKAEEHAAHANDGHDDHGHGHDDHTTKTFAAAIGIPHHPHPDNDLYRGSWDYSQGYAWGMAIDTSSCNGCNACVVACQSENNIPVVGKTEIRRQHEMHWIRIDQYYSGNIDNPVVTNQPLPCMHCENAPCEVVCPVAATVHSDEGLNDMVYNRCVGTRFCSNNCPYKVRRFNWFWYTEHMFKSPLVKMVNNPDVTVRTRGVMEKCTFCVQRINSARIEANNENRSIRDGEIVTACEATCPTNAIVFGNINDKDSRVAKLKASSLNYGLLTELNTKPRTSYLVALSNPNPEIKEV